MINYLTSNLGFSNVINQVNNKNVPVTNHSKNENVKEKQEVTQSQKNTDTRLASLKQAILDGSYEINLKGSAEKMAQELLG